jgi:hypothetical protein
MGPWENEDKPPDCRRFFYLTNLDAQTLALVLLFLFHYRERSCAWVSSIPDAREIFKLRGGDVKASLNMRLFLQQQRQRFFSVLELGENQMKLKTTFALVIAVILLAALTVPAGARIKGDPNLFAIKWLPAPEQFDLSGGVGQTGGQFSKVQIERFTCNSSGNPTNAVDMSCNDEEFGQDFAPDNEIAIAVNPNDPNHLVAGSNDYYYRFNNANGARQAIVPTGFFTSFDGGATWIDGQIPMRKGNGAGDPSPAFDAKHEVVLMAQLENVGGLGGFYVSQGDVSVSRSEDGGVTWSEPITVLKGNGAGIGPAKNATFWDKEWITVDNNSDSEFYGRAYVTSTRFKNGLHGSYLDSPIFLSYSDDGGLTWSEPKEISGSNPDYCTYQEDGPTGECDEDQFSYPKVASDGTLYVHFINGQNEAEWEVSGELDSQIMVVKSTDGGETFSDPVPAAQLEDGLSDMPFSVIRRQTVYGHQIRWTAAGNIAVDPTNPDHVTVVWADRGTANPNATTSDPNNTGVCFLTASGGLFIGTAPNYDPCAAGPGSDLDVYKAESTDGGVTWGPRTVVEDTNGPAWFPWADYKSDGTLVVAWDQDTGPAPADTFNHVLKVGAAPAASLGPTEHPDESVTHWAGQYTLAWPEICGPADSDTPGKGCNVFHGDYTGLAVGSDDSINVVWTGLNALVTSPQVDFYTGQLREGYRQDAMFARR